ncbi:MAG: ribonuclease P protein component [Limisphaerales bacterium]
MNPAPPLCFSRQQRIQRASEFASLKETGQRRVRGCLIANWRLTESGAPSRLGVITSRRIGKAHVRNRARRMMRESFRHLQHKLAAPIDLILVARKSMAEKKQCEVEADLIRILKDKSLLKEDHS